MFIRVHTCLLLSNFQHISCSMKPSQHSRLQRSCCVQASRCNYYLHMHAVYEPSYDKLSHQHWSCSCGSAYIHVHQEPISGTKWCQGASMIGWNSDVLTTAARLCPYSDCSYVTATTEATQVYNYYCRLPYMVKD